MRSDLGDLDVAVSALKGIKYGGGVSITAHASLVAGWSPAVAFNANASAAFAAIVRVSQQTGMAHEDASSRLTTSAAAYDQSEADNQRAVRSVGTNLYGVTALVASYGSGKPASSLLGAEPSYPVKTRDVPEFTGAGMSTDAIMEILHGLRPGEVSAAGTLHTRLGVVLDTLAGRLASNAVTLADRWSGSAAEAAMGQFQQLYARTATLAQQVTQVGSVLSWLGDDVLPQFASLPDPRTSLVAGGAAVGVPGLVGEVQSAVNFAAKLYIAKLSKYLVIANQSLPDNIGATPDPATGSGTSSVSAPAVPGVGDSGVRPPGVTPVGRITTKPPTLQGTTLPTGQLSMPAGTTSLVGLTPSVPGSGMLTWALPGLPPTASGAADSLVGAAAEAHDGTTAPNVGQADGEPPGLGTKDFDDLTGPDIGQLGTEAAGNVAPRAFELVAELADDQVDGAPFLVGEPGISTVGAPAVGEATGGEVANGQPAPLDADNTPARAPAAPDDMEGFPMMGVGGERQSDARERIRQALLDDDPWRPSGHVVPPVISNDK
jgi:uncharacterized protein YukE